jgi:polysaccharide pyruvyl transferase WcaK-like protein
MYHGGYTRANMFGLKLDYRRFLEDLVPALLADESSRLLLVPHTFAAPERVESDPGASRELMAQLPAALRERVHLVTREYNQSEIKGIIGLCDFFIGSRMHACIGALSQGIPTIGVAYSRKFKGVFESIGVGDWVVHAQETEQAAALHQATRLFQRRAELRQLLADKIAGARRLLADTFHELFRVADRG